MGIPKDIECSFSDKVISSSDETYLESQYSKIYKEACALSKKSRAFLITLPEPISRLIRDYELIHRIVLENIVLHCALIGRNVYLCVLKASI